MYIKKTKVSSSDLLYYLIICALVTIILYCFSTGVSGNDFWWHIKVGEYIIKNNVVPTNDIFSWVGTAKEIEWTAHEWLADVILYTIFNCFGKMGIYIFSIVSAGLMTLLLWRQSKKYIRENLLIGGIFFSLFAVLSSLFFYGRPHVFSFFFLLFELKILYQFYEDDNYKGIYFLPLLSVLWSNVHGGSSNLSYLLCIIFLLVGLTKFKFGRIESNGLSKRGKNVLIGVTIGTIIGILVNPIGKQVFLYPYVSFGDKLSMTIISEWQAPDAKIIGNLILYFFPIIVMSIGLFSEQKRIRLIDLVVMLVFLFLFFRSSRFIIMWYISAVFYAFRYVPQCKIKEIKKKSEIISVFLVFVIILIPNALSINNIIKTANEGKLISKVMSDEAIKVVKSDSPQRLFNDYNVGEALIYNDIPVFFDSRADLYSAEHILEDGVSLMYLEQANGEAETQYVDVEAVVKKYNFDAILMLKNRPMYSYMISHPDRYKLIFEDNSLGYFKVCNGGE